MDEKFFTLIFGWLLENYNRKAKIELDWNGLLISLRQFDDNFSEMACCIMQQFDWEELHSGYSGFLTSQLQEMIKGLSRAVEKADYQKLPKA